MLDIAQLNPLHKAGSAREVTQDRVGTECLQEWKLHMFSHFLLIAYRALYYLNVVSDLALHVV